MPDGPFHNRSRLFPANCSCCASRMRRSPAAASSRPTRPAIAAPTRRRWSAWRHAPRGRRRAACAASWNASSQPRLQRSPRDIELDAEEFAAALAALVDGGQARELPAEQGDPVYLTAGGLALLAERAAQALDGYHAEYPLRFAMPREELRSRLALPQREFGAVLRALAPEIVALGDGVAESDWTPAPGAAERRAIEEAEAALVAGGAQPPRLDLDPEVVAYLEGAGQAVDCGDGLLLSAKAYEAARGTVIALLGERESATLGEVRDALETNRRSAQALLETLDRRGVTRRQGDSRVLREEYRGGVRS